MKKIIRYLIGNYKKALVGILGIGLIFMIGCKAPGTNQVLRNFQELQETVNKREFTIKFQWAQPQRGGMIDLTGNPNELKMNGDLVDIFLPYFGVRHRGGAYNLNKGGIRYKGKISNLKIDENTARKNIILEFEAKEDLENLVFIITMYENGQAHASVSSSDRESISYQGGSVTASSSSSPDLREK